VVCMCTCSAVECGGMWACTEVTQSGVWHCAWDLSGGTQVFTGESHWQHWHSRVATSAVHWGMVPPHRTCHEDGEQEDGEEEGGCVHPVDAVDTGAVGNEFRHLLHVTSLCRFHDR
jgi:hypothetical protein